MLGRSHPYIGGVLGRSSAAPSGGRCQADRRRAPPRRASARCSFASTAETWCSTVLGVVERRSAISGLRSPSASSNRISSWRGVSPWGFAWVAGRGPRGRPRTPAARNWRRTISAAGRAPRRSKIASACALGRLIAIHQRQRLLVGAPNRCPGIRRRPPVACHL